MSITNIFGTDGIRSSVGKGPLTFQELPKIGRALAVWGKKKYGASPRILIGSDTRLSCDFVKSGLQLGLLAESACIVDGGILPTPAVAQLVNGTDDFDFGVIISASHNPYYDNGIKIIQKNLGKLSPEDEQDITVLVQNNSEPINYHALGSVTLWPQALAQYEERIASFFPGLSLGGKKILIDTANGATAQAAPALFTRFGAEVILIHAKPNGKNINHNCGATHPEVVKKALLEHAADIGFSFDGDGDRLMVVSKEGDIKDGDDILALLSQHPAYAQETVLVGTIMSNSGLEEFLGKQHKKLLRTPVGDKYIAQKLQEKELLLGGEQSGHIILHDLGQTGDGIVTALRLTELAVKTNDWSLKSFIKYPQVLVNLAVAEKKDLTVGLQADAIQEAERQLPLGRVLARYSGTENLLRVMVEAPEKTQAEAIAQELAQKLAK
jgi:phosphoglucosamine mutase